MKDSTTSQEDEESEDEGLEEVQCKAHRKQAVLAAWLYCQTQSYEMFLQPRFDLIFKMKGVHALNHTGVQAQGYEQFFYEPEAFLALLVIEIETPRKLQEKNLNCDTLEI